MATYNVTSPDGRTFTVNAPSGTSEEELFKYVQSQLYTQPQAAGRTDQEAIEPYSEASYESENPPWYKDVKDVGVAFTSGVSKAAGALVGLGSYVPGVHYLADPVAKGLQDFGAFIDESLLSDRQKEINKELVTRLAEAAPNLPENATMDDYINAMKAGGGEAWEYMKDHPTQIFNLIAASAPYILGGGVISKGLKGGAELAGLSKISAIAKPGQAVSKVLKTPYVGGAVGEGSIVGGQVVTDVIAESDSVGDYDVSRLKAAGTIPITTGLSLLGGRATKALKGIDPDTAVAGKIVSGKSLLGDKTGSGVLNTVYKTGVGATVEGIEETLQSGSEKYWENYGLAEGYNMLNPKLTEGMGGEAVIGGITGAGQGGMINLAAGVLGKDESSDPNNSESEVNPDMEVVNEFIDELDAEKEAEKATQQKVQQYNEANEAQLDEVIKIIEADETNILENLPNIDLEVVNSLESNLEKAVYYLEALKVAEVEAFESDTGRLDTKTVNLISALEQSIESYAPGLMEQRKLDADLDTHSATFPNEKEWEKEITNEEFERLRIEISDPYSQLGKDFKAWQNDDTIVLKGKRDTIPGTSVPTPQAIRAYLGKQSTAIEPGLYAQALADHAALQEHKATEPAAETERINKVMEEFFKIRTLAVKDNNMEALAKLNKLIAEYAADHPEELFETRWKEYLRNAGKEPKIPAGDVPEEVEGDTEAAKKVTKKGEKPVKKTKAEIYADAQKELAEKKQAEIDKAKKEKPSLIDESVQSITIRHKHVVYNVDRNGRVTNAETGVKKATASFPDSFPERVRKEFEKIDAAFRAKRDSAEETEAVDDTEVVETEETMVDILNRDLHENKLSKEDFEKKHPGFKPLWGISRAINQDDVDLLGEEAQVFGDFKMPTDQWQYKLVRFLYSASRRGVLSDYVSFKSSFRYDVEKGDTRESIAEKFNSSVEEIFGVPLSAEQLDKLISEKLAPTDKSKGTPKQRIAARKAWLKNHGYEVKKVRVKDKRYKYPRYRVEYSAIADAPLQEKSRIQIPLTKKVFASLPIEEKYKATKWEMSKLSDDLGIIDESTGKPYLSDKGKDNVKDALGRYRTEHIEAGKDVTSARELITRTMERTAWMEFFNEDEDLPGMEFQEVLTATKESQSNVEEFSDTQAREGKELKEKITTADQYIPEEEVEAVEEDEVTLEQVSQKSKEATDTQILQRSPENYKVGTVADTKARQQMDAAVAELKTERRKLRTAATKAENLLADAQGKLERAKSKTRIAELTKEVRRLKSNATRKRNLADKAAEAVQRFEGFRTISTAQVKKAYKKLGLDLPGTASLETLEQQEKATEERIARAETILEGIDDVSIDQAAALESAWNDNKSKDAPAFSALKIPQRLEWSQRVLLAVHDKAPKDIPNQQKLMEETLDDYIEEPTTKSEEVAARRKLADKQARDKLKSRRRGDTKKVSTKKAAEEYGKAKLAPIYGTFWRSHKDNSILKTHLRNENFSAYQNVVDKHVATFKAMTKKQQREWTALNVRQKGKKSKGYEDSFLEPPRTENWGLLKSDNPKKKENLENFFRRLLGDKEYRRIRKRVYYFNDVHEARRVMKEEFGEDVADVKGEIAFVTKFNIIGQPDIISFILNRVSEGHEESTFVHEVAGHIGFDNLLTKQERGALESQVFGWSVKDRLKYEGEPFYALNVKDMLDQGWKVDTPGYMLNENGERIQIADSIEHLAAREAVRKARGKGYEKEYVNTKTGERFFKVPSDVITSETLTHFLQASVLLGVKPSQTTDTGKILHKMKRALMKFLNYFGKFSDFNMTAQDFMDMALGLAKVDLESGFRIGRKPPSQKAYKAIRIATAGTQTDNIYTGRGPSMNELHADALNMSEEEFRKKHPDFANQWKPLKEDNYITAYLDSLETKATQRFAQQPSDPSNIKNWAAEIDAAARRKFPKDDKGKYVPNDGSRIPLAEWGEFQKSQHRLEKSYRKAAKAYIEQMMRDAAENEARMVDPEGQSYKSFSREEEDIVKKDEKEIKKELADWFPHLSFLYDNLSDGIKNAQKSLRFRGDFINKYKDRLPGLKEAQDVMLRSSKLARSIKKKVDNIAVLERVLKPDRRRMVNKFIEVGTSRQIWPREPEPSTNEQGEEVPRRKVTVHEGFKKLFESTLSEKEQGIVMQVFEHGEDIMELYREVAKELNLPNDFISFAQLDGPYAPLRRFGKHTVTLRSQKIIDLEDKLEEGELPPYEKRRITARLEELRSNHSHFWYEHFPNKGLANRFLKKQKKTGKWGDVSYSKKAVPIGDRGVADQKVLEQVHAAIALSDLETGAKAQIKRMIDQIYTESLNETSARQGRERRKGYGIGGAEQNMLRSFVVNASSEANLVANFKYGKAVNVALSTVRKNATEIDRREDTPDGEMINIYNMLANHYNIRLRKKHHPIVDSIASTITAWFLTSSLSYHLQNGSQTIAVAVPIIAADFKSYSKVMNQLPKSYKIAHKVISYDKKIPFIGSKRATWTLNINLEELPDDHWAIPVLALLDEMELLDLGIEQDLKDTHTGDTGFTSVDKGMKAAGTMSHRLYQVPRGVEAYNRISTALTAYRLGLDNPSRMKVLKTNALDYAIKKTQDTQGDFTSDGAPLAMKWVMENIPMGKLAIQYKKFPLLMAWNFSRSVHMIFAKGVTRKERAIGFRASRNLFAHTVLFSGLRGLPFMASVYSLSLFYMTLFGDEDDKEEIPNDPVVTDGAFERAILDAFPDNPKLAEAIYRGPFAAYANIDTSMKLSHGKTFSLLPFTKFEISEEGFKDIGVGIMGPSGNLAMNVARAGEFFVNGNVYRGIENLMPKGLRDPMEAWRFRTEGYTTKSGTPLAPPKDFSEVSLMLKALGIPARDIVKLKWTRSEQYQIEQFYIDEQRKLRNKYLKASKANDSKTMIAIADQWYALQDGKDRVRGFFNDAPGKIPRTDISSLTRAEGKQMREADVYQEALKTGDFREAR